MEKRVSYIIVGSFVILIGLSLLGFLFWLAKYGNKSIEFDYYHTYFEESVSGLSIESPVKFHGVEVGRVKKITINPKNSEEVEVLLEITQGTPIKKDCYTTLDSQGITGLKYIELRGGSKDSPRIVTSKKNIATIESQKSLLASLFDNGESITKKIDTILDKVSRLLSDENMDHFSSIAQNLSSTALYLDENKHKMGEFMDNANHSLSGVTQDINRFVDSGIEFLEHTKRFENELLPSFEKLGQMSQKAGVASDTTKEFFTGMIEQLEGGQLSVADILEENLEVFNETALSVKSLSTKMYQTLEQIENSPSDLIFKTTVTKLGPGESHE